MGYFMHHIKSIFIKYKCSHVFFINDHYNLKPVPSLWKYLVFVSSASKNYVTLSKNPCLLSNFMVTTNKTNFPMETEANEILFLNKEWNCNKFLLFHLSLSFYPKMYNSEVPCHSEKYFDKILQGCYQYFKLYLKKI